MANFEKAAEYLFGLLTEDETVKSFPKEFVAESAKWVRSWFLKDDPVTSSIVENAALPAATKQHVLAAKLNVLKGHAVFSQELEALLQAVEQHRHRSKNVVSDSEIEVKGNAHIGDKGEAAGEYYDEKNSIKGSNIKAGGDFRVGDDIFAGNQHVNIVHHHYGHTPPPTAPQPVLETDVSDLVAAGKYREAIETLIASGETEAAIKAFRAVRGLDQSTQTSLLIQSSRISALNREIANGTLSNENAKLERNRIHSALLSMAARLP